MMNRYLDWIDILDYIDDIENKTILEIGCGSGTKSLVENFKYVYSYETNTRDKDGKWFNLTGEQNEPSKKWSGFFDKNHPTNPANISLLFNSVEEVVPLNEIDVFFVDAGFINRGECISYFCDKVNFKNVIAHDTSASDSHQYGWNLTDSILTKYYVKHQIHTGQGTILWELK